MYIHIFSPDGCDFYRKNVGYVDSKLEIHPDDSTTCRLAPGSSSLGTQGTVCQASCKTGRLFGSGLVRCDGVHWQLTDDSGCDPRPGILKYLMDFLQYVFSF